MTLTPAQLAEARQELLRLARAGRKATVRQCARQGCANEKSMYAQGKWCSEACKQKAKRERGQT